MSQTSGSFSPTVCHILPNTCSMMCFNEKIRYPKYEQIWWLQSRAILSLVPECQKRSCQKRPDK